MYMLARMIPEPVWPAVVLAAVQLGDAVFCAIPLRFVTSCLDDVGLPPRYRPLLAPLKLAAAVGLVAGLWLDHLGALSALGLTAYFTLAVGAHVRARDLGRNASNAAVLLGLSAWVLATFL